MPTYKMIPELNSWRNHGLENYIDDLGTHFLGQSHPSLANFYLGGFDNSKTLSFSLTLAVLSILFTLTISFSYIITD